MNILLDTHAFLWWILDGPRLSAEARKHIGDGENPLFWSAASSWELVIKYKLGRLPLPQEPAIFLAEELRSNRIESLPITDKHAFNAGNLPRHHNDPFDRMLIAQAMTEDLALLSRDSLFEPYDVHVIW
jgi:PIN domain nuclease of toxin-antitoxin system